MNKDTLLDLGLLEEEAKIYLMLLEYGTSSVSNISRITHIGRVNCYHYIEKLQQKGLIAQSSQSKIKQYTAESPNILINRSIEKLNQAKSIVPGLLDLASNQSRKPRIQFYEGKEGIKTVLEEMIHMKPNEIVSFSNFETLEQFLPEFLPKHFQDRINANIKTRFISPRTKNSDTFTKRFFPSNYPQNLLEAFLIGSDQFQFSSEITIFSGSIAIINLNDQNPVAILIENQELYETQKAIFDLAWLGATSFITQ